MVEVSAPKAKISNPEEVAYFLLRFRLLKKQYGMVYYDRHKNVQALLDLEISVEERETVIDQLDLNNYYKGPHPDAVLIGSEYWEFGSEIKGKPIYIKLSIGLAQGPVICLSFHQAERPIHYPYK